MPKRKSRRDEPWADLAASEVQLEVNTQRERLAVLMSLDFGVGALNHRASAPLKDADRCAWTQLGQASLAKALSPAQTALQAVVRQGTPAPPLIQVSRLTIMAEDAAAAQQAVGMGGVTGSYDVLAIQPLSEQVFVQACTNLAIDIISLDLTKRLSYRMKTSMVSAALQRGVHFEICCSGLLRDEASRRQLFSNAIALTRASRGRGIVLTSGARSIMELRRPLDLLNFGTLMGMTPAQAQAALTTASQAVIAHAKARKAYRGVLTARLATPRDMQQLRPEDGAGQQVEKPKKPEKRTFAQLHST